MSQHEAPGLHCSAPCDQLTRDLVSGNCESDFRLLLCAQELEAVVGGSAFRRIMSALEADAPDAIVVRRTVATGSWINFHTDTVARTVQVLQSVAVSFSSNILHHISTSESYCLRPFILVLSSCCFLFSQSYSPLWFLMPLLPQVPLADDSACQGGVLVFAGTDGRLLPVTRRVGNLLAHDGGAVHGVTALVAGIRLVAALGSCPAHHLTSILVIFPPNILAQPFPSCDIKSRDACFIISHTPS
jgi:hypothetical protein